MWWAYRDRAPHVCRPFNPVPRNPVASWSSLSWKWVSFKFSNQSPEWKKCLKNDNLIEVVMDWGRKPLTRFPYGDWVISRSLSCGRICSMPFIRAVSGSAEIIRDLVEGGGSILVIGPPGVGKTTMMREIARMLADEHNKRIVIVDISNEIRGDGDVPHSGIGRARRMQVPKVSMQHDVMIEAMENHMPETIIIDEIGTKCEALAASTIAQRGVQLVGTAHDMTIENIIRNPSLQLLVGGIESVTLGDEEARSRRVQLTVLERKGPPTFAYAVEIISRTEFLIHHRLDATVDAILVGRSPLFEIRHMDPEAKGSKKHSATPGKKQTQVYEFRHASEFIKHDNRRAETESEDEDADVDIPHHTKR